MHPVTRRATVGFGACAAIFRLLPICNLSAQIAVSDELHSRVLSWSRTATGFADIPAAAARSFVALSLRAGVTHDQLAALDPGSYRGTPSRGGCSKPGTRVFSSRIVRDGELRDDPDVARRRESIRHPGRAGTALISGLLRLPTSDERPLSRGQRCSDRGLRRCRRADRLEPRPYRSARHDCRSRAARRARRAPGGTSNRQSGCRRRRRDGPYAEMPRDNQRHLHPARWARSVPQHLSAAGRRNHVALARHGASSPAVRPRAAKPLRRRRRLAIDLCRPGAVVRRAPKPNLAYPGTTTTCSGRAKAISDARNASRAR